VSHRLPLPLPPPRMASTALCLVTMRCNSDGSMHATATLCSQTQELRASCSTKVLLIVAANRGTSQHVPCCAVYSRLLHAPHEPCWLADCMPIRAALASADCSQKPNNLSKCTHPNIPLESYSLCLVTGTTTTTATCRASASTCGTTCANCRSSCGATPRCSTLTRRAATTYGRRAPSSACPSARWSWTTGTSSRPGTPGCRYVTTPPSPFQPESFCGKESRTIVSPCACACLPDCGGGGLAQQAGLSWLGGPADAHSAHLEHLPHHVAVSYQLQVRSAHAVSFP
jgi:hypothetical protein